MNDLILAVGWSSVLAVAIAGAVWLRGRGVPSTQLRDAFHVGASLWVLGWPLWSGWLVPSVLAALVLGLAISVPALSRRSGRADALRMALTNDRERWRGVVLFGFAYAAGTAMGLRGHPVPPGAALLALSLGDGLGGLVGHRFGRRRFLVPFGTEKSVEGTVVVFFFAALGIALGHVWFGYPWSLGRVLLAAAVAAIVEAAAPRGTDNLLLPASVWLTLAME